MLGVCSVLVTMLGAYALAQTFEGDRCSLPDDTIGVCKKPSNCPSLQPEDDIEICGQNMMDSTTYICCKTGGAYANDHKKKTSVKRVSEKMCEKYAELVYIKRKDPTTFKERKIDRCGIKEEPLIVGGKDAGLREFPHMVLIGYGDEPYLSWSCGGSLVSDRWVLTAAHCKDNGEWGDAKWARVGELDTNSDDDGAHPETIRIVQHNTHPNYNGIQQYNDIALFKLERAILLSIFVRPLCLQVDYSKLTDGATLIASGWGHTSWGGGQTFASSHLQKVNLNLMNNNLCRQFYAKVNKTQLPYGVVDDRQLCAGNETNKDTCHGDSGGPLQYRMEQPYCMYSQVGVTAFGIGCGNGYPGVYTRVSFYIDWIESIVWPNEYKKL